MNPVPAASVDQSKLNDDVLREAGRTPRARARIGFLHQLFLTQNEVLLGIESYKSPAAAACHDHVYRAFVLTQTVFFAQVGGHGQRLIDAGRSTASEA